MMFSKMTLNNVTLTVFILFLVPTVFSQSCNSDICSVRNFGVPCNLAVNTPARFGDLNGNSFGPVENSRFKLVPDVHLGCHNTRTWRKDDETGKHGSRSPCEKLGSLNHIGPIWLKNIHQDRINGLLSFDFQSDKQWDVTFLEHPNTVYLNEHLRCHPDDTSLILVKGKDGSEYCDDDKTQPCFYAEVPAKFTPGGDMTLGESIFTAIVIFGIFLLMLMCIFSSDGNGDFLTGIVAALILVGDDKSSSYSWGGTSDD